MSIKTRFQNAWNAFANRSPTYYPNYGGRDEYTPARRRVSYSSERTIINAIINRIAMDAASIAIEHVQLDENGRFVKDIDDPLNQCLTVSANTNQTGRGMIYDAIVSMLDEGAVCVFPVVADTNPFQTETTEIYSMITAKIIEWYPDSIKIKAYDERDGKRKEIIVPKSSVAIIENPFYMVMNQHNSTMQRLVRKLNLLDQIDENNASTKLDLIIQMPYPARTPARKKMAEERRDEIVKQLADSHYGIAYTDGSEKITQLNRAVESNLMPQIEYLQQLLYSQLGITKEIMEGTADENVMNNYYSRIIEPILSAITDEMTRKFLSPNARTRGHAIRFFRDPFKLVPTSQLADLADKLTRNEIMTSNEIRQIIGLKRALDPTADQLRNKNISQNGEEMAPQVDVNGNPIEGGNYQNAQE
jgi:hypothetical protein